LVYVSVVVFVVVYCLCFLENKFNVLVLEGSFFKHLLSQTCGYLEIILFMFGFFWKQ
jgi:hypothetical protein